MYENIVIGGGIAGLAVIDKLLQSSHKSLLLESSKTLGGKIKTFYSKEGTVQYEAGPWRVNKNHFLLNKLIDEFQLTRIPIDLHLKTAKLKTFKNKPGLSILDTKLLEDESIINAINENVKTGYFDLFDMESSTNAYDIKSINKIENYFVIKEGLNEIIKNFQQKISKECISMESYVLDVEYLPNLAKYKITYQYRIGHNKFIIKKVHSKNVFLCLPPENYINWKVGYFLKPQIFSVETRSLHHIYAKLKGTGTNTIKYHHKLSNPLSQVIGNLYPKNRWIQASYSSGKIADFWNRLRITYPHKFTKLVTKLFNKKLSNIVSYYWENAVHYWTPCFKFNLTKSIDKCIYPHPTKLPNLYLAGESFSSKQAWIEGALETAEKATTPHKKSKIYTMSNLPLHSLVIDNRVLDVSKWIHSHPGSKQVIENHLNEDVTELFHQIHGSSKYANRVLLQLQVGFIK